MLNYTIRRLVLSIPTLLFIALVIFLLLELAPGDPMGQMPLRFLMTSNSVCERHLD